MLARGYCIFYGAATEAEHWFENHLSLQRPPKTPPADFIIDQVKPGGIERLIWIRHQKAEYAEIPEGPWPFIE